MDQYLQRPRIISRKLLCPAQHGDDCQARFRPLHGVRDTASYVAQHTLPPRDRPTSGPSDVRRNRTDRWTRPVIRQRLRSGAPLRGVQVQPLSVILISLPYCVNRLEFHRLGRAVEPAPHILRLETGAVHLVSAARKLEPIYSNRVLFSIRWRLFRTKTVIQRTDSVFYVHIIPYVKTHVRAIF